MRVTRGRGRRDCVHGQADAGVVKVKQNGWTAGEDRWRRRVFSEKPSAR
jgi:hypothetical protein